MILFIGLLCGAPLGSAAVRSQSEEKVRAWRVAHSSLIMGGIPLLAIAGIWALVASSYAFAVVLPLAARYGHRGLSFAPPLLNRAIYCGNMVGAGGLLVGTGMLLWGAYGSL